MVWHYGRLIREGKRKEKSKEKSLSKALGFAPFDIRIPLVLYFRSLLLRVEKEKETKKTKIKRKRKLKSEILELPFRQKQFQKSLLTQEKDRGREIGKRDEEREGGK
jgi:hypothetical protein